MTDEPSRRQAARKARRDAGERTSSIAAALMKLRPAALKNLELDDDLRASIERARAVSSNVARRRAERSLAGELRRLDDEDLDAVEQQLSDTTEAPDTALFHDAERWRTRLVEEDAALAEFGTDDELPQLVAKARGERTSGKPPGAQRALFRHVLAILKTRTARS